ncbi:MAG: VOC family protein [Acidimicrobiales bacterium]
MSGPALTAVVVPDPAETWADAGFSVTDVDGSPAVQIGSTLIRFDDDAVGWSFAEPVGSLLGLPTSVAPRPAADAPDHPNGITAFDHVVVATETLTETIDALAAAGFELRRVRDIPGATPPRQQAFLWAGDVILEVVGPASSSGRAAGGTAGDSTAPTASIWGLALTADDLDATAESLGDRLGSVKDAVQQGRRIATLRTRELGIGLPIAVMSPHPQPR